MRRSITLGYTTSPSDMFCKVDRMMSAVRNASGRETRRFALGGGKGDTIILYAMSETRLTYRPTSSQTTGR